MGQGVIGFIPFVRLIDTLFIFLPANQTIHDMIADTIVVRADQGLE